MKKVAVLAVLLTALCTSHMLFAGGEREEPVRSYEQPARSTDTGTPRQATAESSGEKDWRDRIQDEKERPELRERIAPETSRTEETKPQPIIIKKPEPKPETAAPAAPAPAESKPAETEPEEIATQTDGTAVKPLMNAAGLNAFYELFDSELYLALTYSRLLLPWLGVNIEAGLSLYYFDFFATGGVVFDLGFSRIMINAGYDSYSGFIIHPMVGFEIWRILIVLEMGFSADYDFVDSLRMGVGAHFMF